MTTSPWRWRKSLRAL